MILHNYRYFRNCSPYHPVLSGVRKENISKRKFPFFLPNEFHVLQKLIPRQLFQAFYGRSRAFLPFTSRGIPSSLFRNSPSAPSRHTRISSTLFSKCLNRNTGRFFQLERRRNHFWAGVSAHPSLFHNSLSVANYPISPLLLGGRPCLDLVQQYLLFARLGYLLGYGGPNVAASVLVPSIWDYP